MKIIHARKQAHLKLRGAETRGFVSSTHLAPLEFSPNNTKWVEKASGKKTSAAHNLTAENYSSLSKKEKESE